MTARLKIFRIRSSDTELKSFAQAAKVAGLAVSTWARSELIAAARLWNSPEKKEDK